jgi:hypothetical protein
MRPMHASCEAATPSGMHASEHPPWKESSAMTSGHGRHLLDGWNRVRICLGVRETTDVFQERRMSQACPPNRTACESVARLVLGWERSRRDIPFLLLLLSC